MPKRINYAQQVVPQAQPQTVQTHPAQIQNQAGGFVFEADKWTQLRRFLVLGSESNSYYVSAKDKTYKAQALVRTCLIADGFKVVDMAVDVSQGGYAPKNDPALWVMSMACSPQFASEDVVKYALKQMRLVARTLSFLYTFLDMVQTTRGWGRGLRTAVSDWFAQMGFHGTAYQVIKYRQRNGWTAQDAARLSHVKASDIETNAIFRWLTNGTEKMGAREVKRKTKIGGYTSHYMPLDKALPQIIYAFEQLQKNQAAGKVLSTAEWEVGKPAENLLERMMGGFDPVVQAETVVAEAVRLIEKFDLTWEMLPTQLLNEKDIWTALVPNLPYTALMRNLATMTRANVFSDKSILNLVCSRLINQDAIVKAKVHPINILAAQMTYAQGKGIKGSNTWTPERRISDALNEAFPLAYAAVEPTGQNILIAIDVSSSMLHGQVNGMEYMNASQGATALAVSILGSELNAEVMAFDTEIHACDLSPRNRLDVSMKQIAAYGGGGTDCNLPFQYALNRLDNGQIDKMYDAIILLTDAQTWAGYGSVDEWVAQCRTRNPQLRVVEVALEANELTTEQDNPLTLRIAGLDSSAPKLINSFLLGKV